MTILADMPQEIMTEYVERAVSRQTVDSFISSNLIHNSYINYT